MALPNTDFGAGRPATKAETFGTSTGADSEVIKGLDDIEDAIDKRLETISLFVEKIANYIPKLGGIEHHVKQISGLRIRDSVMPAMREIIDAISLDTEKDEERKEKREGANQKVRFGSLHHCPNSYLFLVSQTGVSLFILLLVFLRP